MNFGVFRFLLGKRRELKTLTSSIEREIPTRAGIYIYILCPEKCVALS